MLPGSGEYCLPEILEAGAFAKIPLVNRIPNLKTDSEGKEGMEVHFVYGQNDWMDFRGGLEVQRLCHQRQVEWEQQSRDNNDSGGNNNNSKIQSPPKIHVHGVRDASHLLMLDNPREFNSALIVAAGGHDKLPPNMPRPVEFACDEVITASYSRARNILGEEGAVAFFRGARFNRGRKQQVEEAQGAGEDGLEEKKVEEQLA